MTLELHDLVARRGHFRLGPLVAKATPGSLVALLGGNGSGKSTLLGLLAGAVHAESGEARWKGIDLLSASPAVRASNLAFVPQRPALDAAFTVRECVELGRFALERRPERVTDAIGECDLVALAWRRWHDLSEGQRQRAALARAMAQHDRGGLMLLDEPFAAMDPASTRQSLGIVRRRAAAGAVVLLATHDLMLAGMADQVWLLRDGSLVAAGDAARVLVPQVLESIYGVEFTLVEGLAERPIPLPRLRDGGASSA